MPYDQDGGLCFLVAMKRITLGVAAYKSWAWTIHKLDFGTALAFHIDCVTRMKAVSLDRRKCKAYANVKTLLCSEQRSTIALMLLTSCRLSCRCPFTNASVAFSVSFATLPHALASFVPAGSK